jgi:MFS family permease
MKKNNRQEKIVAYLGNFIDFLEFGLFAAFLPYISLEFFGHHDVPTKLMVSYLILYCGFVSRPLGGYFLGRLADKIGVKKILFLSILGISLSSLCVGLCPKNEYAWIFVIFFRFLQGIFTGGEQAAATVYVVHDNKNNNYLSSALLVSCGILGVCFSQYIVYMFSVFNITNWRMAFVLVSIMGFCVFYFRYIIFKEKFFERQKKISEKVQIKTQWKTLLFFIILISIINSVFYLINSFFNNYQMIITSQIISSKLLITLLSTIFFSIAIIAWGYLLDKKTINVLKLINISLVGIACFIIPLFITGLNPSSFWMPLWVQCAMIVFSQLLAVLALGTLPKYFAQNTRVQLTGISVSIGASLVGGAMPLLASTNTADSLWYNHTIWAFFVLVLCGLIGNHFFMREDNNAITSKGFAA